MAIQTKPTAGAAGNITFVQGTRSRSLQKVRKISHLPQAPEIQGIVFIQLGEDCADTSATCFSSVAFLRV